MERQRLGSHGTTATVSLVVGRKGTGPLAAATWGTVTSNVSPAARARNFRGARNTTFLSFHICVVFGVGPKPDLSRTIGASLPAMHRILARSGALSYVQ